MSSYHIYEFDGVALPLYNAEQDLSTGAVDSTLLASVGGSFDVWSGLPRTSRAVRHTVSGVYQALGGSLYVTDHLGNYIIDHAGNRMIAGTAQAILRGQVDAIRAKHGSVGLLWRRRWDDQAVAQWKRARLLAVQEKSDVKHRTVVAKVDCVFESAMANWRAAAADVASGNLVGGGAVGLLLANGGNATAADGVITVTASGVINSLQFAVAALGVDLRYTGSLGAGSVLRIDCGSQAVTVNGSAAYAGFSLGSGHTARGWLPLGPGSWAMLVSSNGPGSVQASFYDQWV